MVDIVERLRICSFQEWQPYNSGFIKDAKWPVDSDIGKEAAAEIQHLRAEVERLTQIAEDRLADNARLTNEKTDALLSAAYSRAEAFERAARIARNRAKGNERLAMSHPEGSDGRRLAVERCKEADQITFAIEAERIRQAGKDGGAG